MAALKRNPHTCTQWPPSVYASERARRSAGTVARYAAVAASGSNGTPGRTCAASGTIVWGIESLAGVLIDVSGLECHGVSLRKRVPRRGPVRHAVQRRTYSARLSSYTGRT